MSGGGRARLLAALAAALATHEAVSPDHLEQQHKEQKAAERPKLSSPSRSTQNAMQAQVQVSTEDQNQNVGGERVAHSAETGRAAFGWPWCYRCDAEGPGLPWLAAQQDRSAGMGLFIKGSTGRDASRLGRAPITIQQIRKQKVGPKSRGSRP